MAIKLIAAVSQNGVIGKDGQIPWRISQDLKRFSALTKGSGNNAVIMGRKTWDSIPSKYRPLPKRMNVVISSRPQEGASFVLESLHEAIRFAQIRCDDVWLIGGQGIYQEALSNYANRDDNLSIKEIHLTMVHACYTGDTFFPYFDSTSHSSPFRVSGIQHHEGEPAFTFLSFDRRR